MEPTSRSPPDDETGEQRSLRLVHLHAFASRVSAEMLRLSDPQGLAETACRLAVDHGFAVLAWVGIVGDDGDVVAVARFGRDEGYVDLVRLRIRDDATARGPAAKAVLLDRVAVSNDIASEQDFQWKAAALARGLRSCAVFPLRMGDGTRGVFALYGGELGAFQGDEVEVLGSLADNLSFAIASSRTAEERNRLLLAMQERVKELTLVHRITRELQANRCVDAALLADLVALVPSGWQHATRCAARLRWNGMEAQSAGFRETRSGLLEHIDAGGRHGSLEVVYLDAPAETEPFLDEERELLRSIADLLASHFGRMAAEEERRSSEVLLRIASGVARLGGFDVDVPGLRVAWSKEARALVDLPPVEASTLDAFLERVVPEARDGVRRAFDGCIGDGTALEVEAPVVATSGRRRWMRLCGRPERDGDGRVVRVLGAIQDIDERRRLEERLRQAQKMEAIGRLAGGVAHDFNNLLSVILSYASFIEEGLPPDDALRSDAQEIAKAGTKAAALTSQLLAFSRQQMVQPRVVDFHGVIAGMERMLPRIVREDVELTFHVAPSPGPVLADAGQIEQVVMNLVVNARDAMPRGGSS